MTKIKTITVAVVFVSCLAAPACPAELGNIIAPSNAALESQSREASAAIARGLQKIMAAIEDSELRKIGNRQENLTSAANVLQDAAKQTASIEIPDALDVPVRYEKLTDAQRGFLFYVLDRGLKRKHPENVRELFKAFVDITALLAQETRQAARSKNVVLDRPYIAAVARYLSFASLIAETIQISVGG